MKTLNQSLRKKASGLTLIEILVTMVITSIGLMGLLSLQMQAMKATQDTGNKSQAIWIFNDLANRIRANETSSVSYAVGLVNCAAPPVAVCSNFFNGAATTTSAICTGPQLAAWDLFEIACGAPRNGTIRGNPISNLPGAQLTVVCVTPAGCANGDPLLATLTWRARLDIAELDGRIRAANDNLITQTRVLNP
jgi:type IV pilus assembly protein PilV